MDFIYYASVLLFIIILPLLLIILLFLLVRPNLFTKYTGKVWSRLRILGVGLGSMVASFFIFGSVMAATMPESIRNLTQQQDAAHVLNAEKQSNESAQQERIVRTVTVISVIKYTSSERQDANLSLGQRSVTVAGIDGSKAEKYEVAYLNGKEASRKLIESRVTKEPVNEIVSIGTHVAPVATPQPAISTPLPTAPSTGTSAFSGEPFSREIALQNF